MSALFALARAVHFATAMLLFGSLVFLLGVARPSSRLPGGGASALGLERWFATVARWSIAASVLAWLVCLGCEAAIMSGDPIAEAVRAGTLAQVLADTGFGRMWSLRLGLVIGLALVLRLRMRATTSAGNWHDYSALGLAGVYLASLAWMGHATALTGMHRNIQLAADVVHLLAAGAWVGSLPMLVAVLGASPPVDDLIAMTRRYSAIAVITVVLLLFTGTINARYLVGDAASLIGTPYGRLLCAKLALVVAMVALAAVNRFVLTPRLADDTRDRLRLRRNALLEIAAGLGIVAIVGALGITAPPH